jgi:hypothetical protein
LGKLSFEKQGAGHFCLGNKFAEYHLPGPHVTLQAIWNSPDRAKYCIEFKNELFEIL